MGYYTRFKVDIADGSLNDFEAEVLSRNFMTLEKLIAADLKYDPFESECKWYDHDKDMIKFSRKHPNTLFLLSGEGEENGDNWKSYYRNGKSAHIKPEVIWPVFNESMLS